MDAVEPTTPSAARIYDYLLGGTHNYEVDRVVGRMAEDKVPLLVQFGRMNRNFLGQISQQLAAAGFGGYIDLATGIPTEGYLHELVPETARILYNDADSEVVAYGREIVGERPNIRYVQSRIEDIETILAVAEEHLEAERRVGICMIGITYFIDAESLARAFQHLYDWAAPGSLLAVTGMIVNLEDQGYRDMTAMYERQGVTAHPHTPSQLLELAQPWRLLELRAIESYAEQDLETNVVLPHERGQVGYGGLLLR